MTDFKFDQLRTYFMKTNTVPDVTLKELEPNDLVGMAILSIFDKKGLTVKTPQYSYEKPDGLIDKSEIYGVTEKQYDKAVKDIQKVLKKETGKDFSSLKIPSYLDMMKMMNDDKVDFQELATISAFREGSADAEVGEKIAPVKAPEKQGDNKLSGDELADFISNADLDVLMDVHAKVKNGEKYAPETAFQKQIDAVQKSIDEFVPDDVSAYSVQNMSDGEQYNEKGQLITRVNNVSGVYEKYKYEGDSKEYSEMVQYKPNGYKAMYFKRESLIDKNGSSVVKKVAYSLDENEKIYKILPPQGYANGIMKDFNDNNEYLRFMEYAKRSSYDDATLDAMLSP